MAYATQQDLIDWCGMNGEQELIQLTDPNNTSINSFIVLEKLGQADAEINARLVGVTLPMAAPYPPMLVATACRIARALLYRYGRPEWVDTDYREAMQWLDDVRTGKASIGLDGTGSAEVDVTAGAVVIAPDVVFTAEVLATL